MRSSPIASKLGPRLIARKLEAARDSADGSEVLIG
jgi:hypothetical protein